MHVNQMFGLPFSDAIIIRALRILIGWILFTLSVHVGWRAGDAKPHQIPDQEVVGH